jgi:hypothetical protein
VPRRSFQLRQGLGAIGGIQGSVVRPSTVVEDASIRADGWVNLPDKPLEGYLDLAPYDYNAVAISWNVTTEVDWLEVVIVASETGEPLTVLDGRQVARFESDTPAFQFLDTGLEPGVWMYYSLFVKLDDGFTQWYERLYASQVLVPANWGSTQMLWDRIPEYYRVQDAEFGGGSFGPLYRFLEALGWEIDYTRTLVSTIAKLNDPKVTVDHALREFGTMLGVSDDVGDLGTTRYRVLCENIMHLRKKKGTYEGINGYIAATTGYRSDITIVNPDRIDIRIYAQRVNLVRNPKFVGGTAQWTITLNTATSNVSGNVLTLGNGGGSTIAPVLLTNLFPTAPGYEYSLGMQFNQVAGPIQIEMLWNGTTAVPCQVRTPFVNGTTQQRIETTSVVAPAGADSGRYRITLQIPVGGTFKLTNVLAEIGQVAEYFDGDTQLGGYFPGGSGTKDFRWENTANQSYSFYNLDFGKTQDILMNLMPLIIPVGMHVGGSGSAQYDISDWTYFPGKT